MGVLRADAGHTSWTDPGDLAPRLRELPVHPVALADALEEFVIHHAVARQIGVGVPAYAEPVAAALAGIELLPWDDWGIGLDVSKTRQVSPEQAEQIDALAAALDPAPPDRTAGAEVLARFAWARPAGSVVSFPAGRPQDIALVELSSPPPLAREGVKQPPLST